MYGFVTESMHLEFQYPMSKNDVEFREGIKAGQLKGLLCPSCGHCYVPPRQLCTQCLVDLEGWRKLEPRGIIRAMTVVTQVLPGLPKPPYALAYVQPFGADTCILNFVQGARIEGDSGEKMVPNVGDEVSILFQERREGRITDFYFIHRAGADQTTTTRG